MATPGGRGLKALLNDIYYNFWLKGPSCRNYTLAERWPAFEEGVVRYQDAVYNLFNHPNQDPHCKILPVRDERATRRAEIQDGWVKPMIVHKYDNDQPVYLNERLGADKKLEASIKRRDLTWWDVRPIYANPTAMVTAINYGDRQVLQPWDYNNSPAKRYMTEMFLTSPWYQQVAHQPMWVTGGTVLSEWYSWSGLLERDDFVDGAADHALFRLPEDGKYDWGPQFYRAHIDAIASYNDAQVASAKFHKRQDAELDQKRADMAKLKGGVIEENKKQAAGKLEQ